MGEANCSAWFGITSFAFGAFNIAIVVYDDMEEPWHFFKVTAWSYFLCWIFYSAVALLGYMHYGSETKEVIYFNFPEGSISREISLVSICVVLMLTYVLQMMPIYNCVQLLSNDVLHYSVIRGTLVALTTYVSYVLPSISICLEIVGALSAAITSFI